MPVTHELALPSNIKEQIKSALSEDCSYDDISGNLFNGSKRYHATILCKQSAMVCGSAWVNEVYSQLDTAFNTDTRLEWHKNDGDMIDAAQHLVDIHGSSKTILAGERTALNFLQLLSGVASTTHSYQQKIKQYDALLLDTRKTLPNLRIAQKYAVRIGGGHNHRMDLKDAIMLKENHLSVHNDIKYSCMLARNSNPHKQLIVEVENIAQLKILLECDVDIALLDNFNLQQLQKAVQLAKGKIKLEASGNIDLENVAQIAAIGIDRISVGALTKNVTAIDWSMRFRAKTTS